MILVLTSFEIPIHKSRVQGSFRMGRVSTGSFLEPGGQVDIRFIITRSGRYRFQCSIHPEMEGEIFLLSVGAV